MKKAFSFVFSLFLAVSLICFAFADSEFLFDDYGYIKEISLLNETAGEIAEQTGYIVSCSITDSIDGMNGNEQAQHIFEEKFGGREGMILLDCIDTQKYFVYFSREINSRLTEADARALFVAYDSQNDYDSAVSSFMNTAKEILLPLHENVPSESSPVPENKGFSRVVDLASVISQSELEKLTAYADSISEQYQCDVAAVIVDRTAPKDTQAFADDFYDDYGFGYGENDDGILLLIAVKDRRYAISTYGYGIRAFSDQDLDNLIGRFRGYLSAGNWADAALEFITGCGEVLYRRAYEQQNNAAVGPINTVDPINLIIINIAVGLIIGCVIVSSMKSKHTTVKSETRAFNYLREGSFRLTHSNDRFINSQLSRVRKPEPQNRAPGGYHGGGSTHISSSGRTHGGKSGGF